MVSGATNVLCNTVNPYGASNISLYATTLNLSLSSMLMVERAVPTTGPRVKMAGPRSAILQ